MEIYSARPQSTPDQVNHPKNHGIGHRGLTKKYVCGLMN
jgi:hypothetical protein